MGQCYTRGVEAHYQIQLTCPLLHRERYSAPLLNLFKGRTNLAQREDKSMMEDSLLCNAAVVGHRFNRVWLSVLIAEHLMLPRKTRLFRLHSTPGHRPMTQPLRRSLIMLARLFHLLPAP